MTSWASVVWMRSSHRTPAAELVCAEVSRLCGLAPDSVRLSRVCAMCGSDTHGRPVVVPWSAAPPPAVSVSRSLGLTVVVVASGSSVGIDVEDIGSFADHSVSRVLLHEQERADLPVELATLWVRKEALLKAAGCGLSVDPSLIRVSGPWEPAAVLAWPDASRPNGPDTSRPNGPDTNGPDPNGAAELDWLVDLEVAPEVCAAMAGSGPPPDQVTIRQAGAEALLG